MAENEKKVEKSVSEKQHVTDAAHSADRKKWMTIAACVAIGAVIALLLCGIMGAVRHNSNGAGYGAMRGGMMRDGRGPGDNDGDGDRRGGMMMRGGYDSNTMVHGVVSAVSDTEMTVVGNGVAKKVALPSSTTYGANKPKVNDTVAVRGTTSGETFTATSVQIVNK